MDATPRKFCSDLRECLLLGLIALLLVAASPFVAIMLFAARPLVIAAGLLALGAVVSPLVIAPRMRGRWQADVAPEGAYRGLRLARDVGLHRGHSWAWIGEDEVVVGADDLAQAEVGPIDLIELPAEGTRVQQDEPLFRIRHGSRALELPSPVSGTVVRLNERLRDQPELVNRRPFSLGWVARIRADEHLVDDRSHLRFGGNAWRWFRSEVDRVLRTVPAFSAATDGDSEPFVERLHSAIDEDTWRTLGRAEPAMAVG